MRKSTEIMHCQNIFFYPSFNVPQLCEYNKNRLNQFFCEDFSDKIPGLIWKVDVAILMDWIPVAFFPFCLFLHSENKWFLSTISWPCEPTDLESRTRVLLRLAEKTSHRGSLEVLCNLPGLKEPNGERSDTGFTSCIVKNPSFSLLKSNMPSRVRSKTAQLDLVSLRWTQMSCLHV